MVIYVCPLTLIWYWNLEMGNVWNLHLLIVFDALVCLGFFLFVSGFENAESACCQVIGQHGGLVPCESFSRVCRDRTKYVFWEPFHPTETANLITAKHALDGGLNYVSPINIRQLTNSWATFKMHWIRYEDSDRYETHQSNNKLMYYINFNSAESLPNTMHYFCYQFY